MYIQVPQIGPCFSGAQDGEAEKELLAAVIILAIKDLNDRGRCAAARNFFESEGFDYYCYWLSLNADAIRERVL